MAAPLAFPTFQLHLCHAGGLSHSRVSYLKGVTKSILLLGMPASKSLPSFAERFWSKVCKADGDACWEWTAAKFPNGYGKVALPRKNGSSQELDGAHRIAWLMTNGPIPLDLWVLHKCDNRSCCRPDHLFLGTHQDNMADMIAKGRNPVIRGGVRPPTAKIEPAAIVEIRQRAASGESHRAIARSLQLDRRKVDRIVKRELYSTVA